MMMSEKSQKMMAGGLFVVGLSIWIGVGSKLHQNKKFHFVPNIAAMKGSPYGKVLALAIQGPIGVYFHKGESHETLKALGEPHIHADGRVCYEAHEGEADDKGVHSEHDHVHEHEEDQKQHAESNPEDLPLHRRLKDQFKKMKAYAHRNTDGRPLSPEHEKYLQSENEDMLRLAYELDPSNYTNYNNYHLFLSVNDFGKSAMDQEAAVALARKTIQFCERETVDPASWLTAASAAYNVITYVGRNYEKCTNQQVKASLFEFDKCMKTYETLLDESQKKSLYIPEARLKEMLTRARFLRKLREAQGVYLKRKMTRRKNQGASDFNNKKKMNQKENRADLSL